MSNKEFYKVLLSALLVIMVMLITLMYTSIDSLESWCFPYFDLLKDDISKYPVNTYCIDISWFVKRLADKSMLPVFVIIIMLKPNLNRWRISPAYAWLFFYIVWAIDYVLFFESLDWRGYIDIILCFITISYTSYCGYLTFIKKKLHEYF